jgi:hypothetical protein
MTSMPFEILRKHSIILGNLPMLGVSYQGATKDSEYKERFRNKAEMKKVVRTALNYGVKFFAASSRTFNPLAPNYLDAVKEIEAEDKKEIRLIPCIDVPLRFKGKRVDDFRRWKTHLEYETEQYGSQIKQRYLEDPILNCRQGWKEGLNSAKPYKNAELVNDLEIDWKAWETSINEFSDYNVGWIEPGSGTDFLAISRMNLLEELLEMTRQTGHRVLLGSHHIGASNQLISKRNVKGYDGFITPVNKLGAMMFPTQEMAEASIKDAKKQGKIVVAIKPFAGGRIPPKEALIYVFKKVEVDACMVGIGSVAEAKIDLLVAEKVLASLPFRSR